MGFSLHLPRASSFVFPGHQLRDGQHKQSSSNCCGCLVSSGALQQAQGQPSAPASLTEGAAASAAVTGQLQAGTQAVAAQDHVGSHHVSSGHAQCAGVCLVQRCGGLSAVAPPAATWQGAPMCRALCVPSCHPQDCCQEQGLSPTARHAAVGEWQLCMLCKLLEASLNLG